MDYSKLIYYYEKIESTSKRLEKTKYISELLENTKKEDIQKIIFLLQGRVFPRWDDQKIGIASKLVLKALSKSTGLPISKIEDTWKKTGDLGITSEKLVSTKKQATLFSQKLSVDKVFSNLKKLASIEGMGSIDQKIGYISELLTSAEPKEAKYIIRTLLEELRVGASIGTLRDGICFAYFSEIYNDRDNGESEKEKYNSIISKIQNAYDITNDYSKIVDIIIEEGEKGLDKIKVKIGVPINPMLFIKAKNIENGFEIVGKPCAIEHKIDGFRVQIHKSGQDIKLFTRRLENVTPQFPDIVKIISENVNSKECILDSEVVGFDEATKKWLPFQNISQRIKRKYDIEEISKSVPVMCIVFDIIENEGHNLLNSRFEDRRKELEKAIKQKQGKIELITQLVTDNLDDAKNFYEKSLELGNEGIMMKNLDAIYKAGARVGLGVKVKPVLESLDLVITGAEWGQGKRNGWLSSFIVSCQDDFGEYVEIGKVGTGIKELDDSEQNESSNIVSFEKLTNLLKPLIISENNRIVNLKPEIVVEIEFEEIQKSINYDSGFALRFPRLKVIRTDRDPKDCSDIETIQRIYDEQRGRNS
jgi:DNA ligase-1